MATQTPDKPATPSQVCGLSVSLDAVGEISTLKITHADGRKIEVFTIGENEEVEVDGKQVEFRNKQLQPGYFAREVVSGLMRPHRGRCSFDDAHRYYKGRVVKS